MGFQIIKRWCVAVVMVVAMAQAAWAVNTKPVVTDFTAGMSGSTITGSFTIADDGGQVTRLRAHFDNAAGNSGISCYVDVGGAYDTTQVTGAKTFTFDTTGQCGTLFSQGANGSYRSVIEAFDTATLQASKVYAYFGKTSGGVISLPRTGQTTSYAAGDDGAVQAGVPWPDPRFTDNSNGTVTDNLTGLIWLKNANCFGAQAWATAITSANSLASGACGLSDGSTVGQWRLPNITELESLVDAQRTNPALPSGYPFSAVQADYYWSSNTNAYWADGAWNVDVSSGSVCTNIYKAFGYYVWPVRAGQ